MATSTVMGRRWQWKDIKLGLSIADIVLGVAILCLASALEFLLGYGLFAYSFTPPAATAILWDVAELATLVTTRGEHGIIPGAHVAAHLLVSLGFITDFILLVITSIFGDIYDQESEDDRMSRPRSRGILWTQAAFVILAMTTQITLLIVSCREEHVRRQEKHKQAHSTIVELSQTQKSQLK